MPILADTKPWESARAAPPDVGLKGRQTGVRAPEAAEGFPKGSQWCQAQRIARVLRAFRVLDSGSKLQNSIDSEIKDGTPEASRWSQGSPSGAPEAAKGLPPSAHNGVKWNELHDGSACNYLFFAFIHKHWSFFII